MKHYTVIFKPDNVKAVVRHGESLLEAGARAGIILNTACGARGTCEKCAITILPQNKKVLACQYHLESDITAIIPDHARLFEHKILTRGVHPRKKLPNDIYKKYLNIASQQTLLGLAVDIGTTTVVAKLLDLKTAEILDTKAALNPQSKFGDDVISRITFAENDEKLAILQKTIIDCINDLITKLCDSASIQPDSIFEICVVGNTTMNHIFRKLPVTQLGQAPYKAFSLDAADIPADKLQLKCNPCANVHTVENIAGFVGSDTAAVAYALDLGLAEKMSLAIDIGTNGEIVLGTKNQLLAASCAAGPALEGARITCGSRAQAGAIESVAINQNDIDIEVIANKTPLSICGSGLIDIVAVLLELKIIDQTGRFQNEQNLSHLPDLIRKRIFTHDDQPAFKLADGPTNVFITQADIRQMQLAKAAIRTGIVLLQKKLGINDAQIEKIYIAGAFGNYIRPQSAMAIGLLPDVPIEKIQFVGNAANSGAQMILLSQKAREHIKDLSQKIEYVEIAHEPDFSDVYADTMFF